MFEFRNLLSGYKKILVLPVFTVLVLASTFSIYNAYAASSFELQIGDGNHSCEAIGGVWTSTNTCTLASTLTLNSGDSLTVDLGVALKITSIGTINNSGTITNKGDIIYTQITNKFGGNINNFGTIRTNTFFSNLYNNGTLNNNPGATLRAARGSVEYNFAAGTINNSGTMTDTACPGPCAGDSVTVYNYNIINNNSGGKIFNFFHFVNFPVGVINNNAGATITNNFIFYQQGTVNNFGTFVNHGGDVTPAPNCKATFNNVGAYLGKFPDIFC